MKLSSKPSDRNIKKNKDFLLDRGFGESKDGSVHTVVNFGISIPTTDLRLNKKDLIKLILNCTNTFSATEAVEKMKRLLNENK